LKRPETGRAMSSAERVARHRFKKKQEEEDEDEED
jgi:hypothetical protein